MCLIVDANLASLVFGEPLHDDFRPIIDWLTSPNKNGKLVVGGHLAVELNRLGRARRFIRSLQQAGRARFIPEDVTKQETNRVSSMCESNDPHIIALAKISGARLLCSRDTTLHRDFTNPELISDPRGHIYQTSEHEHLLRKYGHTSACRKSAYQNLLQ
jgi:hypothetical protein